MAAWLISLGASFLIVIGGVVYYWTALGTVRKIPLPPEPTQQPAIPIGVSCV